MPIEDSRGPIMYHQTRSNNRDSIAQHGLMTSYSDDVDDFLPRGVYMTPTMPKPYAGPQGAPAGHWDVPDDIWSIDTSKLQHLEPDSDGDMQEFGGSYWTRHDVPPHAMKLIHQGHIVGRFKVSDAEQAKSTGAMVALYPRQHDAQMLVVPGGEPIEELHMTVVYLGEDVTDQDPTELIAQMDYVSANFSPIEAKAFGIAQFNPAGDDPCMVYLIGGSPDITEMYRQLRSFVEQRYPGAAEQHDPFVPHVTAGYGLTPNQVTYTGPVLFDRVGLAWAGHTTFYDL